ncbi:uncharacterized protein PFL1_01858 [Pseudozyma flocculosa PF-1]|uniref:Uncharacterized protein n=1 Tax=Pseudozyma flocculosa TaxID=84751 RepID=A0A5C3EZA4_9BASI|nr:uncharacterized protein PFL1_01858 [Pseudozyma flocculosa PF-1]EPQ30332.1 hypothetical protein PFL1_01858 [Pseudozyma flocculosa PF-1]SPO37402.1 uncharacterized protein PSFLO_02875 [Pseudozyma flocculosa]
MFSGAPDLASRPKPPANRRPSSQLRRISSTSNQSGKDGTDGDGGSGSRPTSSTYLDPSAALDPRQGRAAPQRPDRGHGHVVVLDRDLDLDLPDDLTAALERNVHRWPKGRVRVASACHPSADASYVDGEEAQKQGRIASYGSLGRNTTARHTMLQGGEASEGAAAGPVRPGIGGKRRPSLQYIFSTPERQRRAARNECATQNTPDPASQPGEDGQPTTMRGPRTAEHRDGLTIADARGAVEDVFAEDDEAGAEDDEDADDDDDSDAKSLASEASSFDREWVGNLGRDELEAMLMQANRIIKAREKDLVMAAAIGKALLEKNISLRQKHTGIASRLASSTSIFDMAQGHGQGQTQAQGANGGSIGDGVTNDARLPCSPPTTDVDLTAMPATAASEGETAPSTPVMTSDHKGDSAADGDDDERTPVASGNPTLGRNGTADYFGHATLSTPYRTVASGHRQPLGAMTAAPQRTAGAGPTEPRSTRLGLGGDDENLKPRVSRDDDPWVPSQAGLIVSRPASPTGSVSASLSFRANDAFDDRGRRRPALSQVQAAEAQRQLARLSEQNEALLQQLSELQEEAERAKRDGSKKLSRLDKEIGGLKAELEAATRRNVELEQGRRATNSGDDDGADDVKVTHRRGWTRGKGVGPISPLLQGTLNIGLQASLTPVRSNLLTPEEMGLAKPAGAAAAASRRRYSASESSVDGTSAFSDDAAGGIPISASDLEEMLGYRPGNSEGEQALVARLLAKIQELRETNRAMAQAGSEMDGRLGRAMEEGERLKDAYEAVEISSVAADLWPGGADDAEADEASKTPGEAPSNAVGTQGLMTPSGSRGDLDLLALSPGSATDLNSSPSRRRRAPGNRYAIETRKTIRAALRRERQQAKLSEGGRVAAFDPAAGGLSRSTTADSLASYSLDLSQSSSAASSPNSRRIIKKVSGTSIGVGAAARPRIRITPSIEDLGARRKPIEVTIAGDGGDDKGRQASSKDWEDLPSPTQERPGLGGHDGCLKPSDALHCAPPSDRLLTEQWMPRPSGADNRSRSGRPSQSARDISDSCDSRAASPSPADRVLRTGAGHSDELPVTPERPARLTHSSYSFSSLASMSRSSSINNVNDLDWAQRRTLGSELGSIFGGDDRKNDFNGEGDDSAPTMRAGGEIDAVEGPLRLSDLDDGGSGQTLMQAVSPAQLIRYKRSDRPTASFGRLVPEDDADEDQEDIECVLQHMDAVLRVEPPSPQDERDSSLIAVFAESNDGEWRAGDDIVERAGLKDLEQPRGDQYDLICAAVGDQPVQWADDDDYGRPITETEARRIGLLQLPSAGVGGRGQKTLPRKSRSSVLLGYAWAAGRKLTAGAGGTSRDGKGPQVQRTSKLGTARQLESEEQVLERRKLEELLRRRRIEVLRSRGYDADDGNDSDGRALEAEVNARVLAISPARHRLRAEKARASRAPYLGTGRKLDFGQLDEGDDSRAGTAAVRRSKARAKSKGKGKARLIDPGLDDDDGNDVDDGNFNRQDGLAVARMRKLGGLGTDGRVERLDETTRDWVRATSLAAGSRSRRGTLGSDDDAGEGVGRRRGQRPDDDDEAGSSTSSEFELLEAPVEGRRGARRVKRQGDEGTDYFPISLRARYQPEMVKQRVKIASNEAYFWISTWITFTTVIVFAFVVAVRRGPGPVLGTSGSTGTRASRRAA